MTNKHYRRFYDDELENDKEIFPESIFTNIDIKRGQSRGVKKSWFSFGGGQEDESGQESTIRTIGKFKGIIDISNTEDQKLYEAEEKRLLDEIFKTLSQLYESKNNQKKEFKLMCLSTSESKTNFVSDCKKMGVVMPELTTFLEDLAFSKMIKQLLSKQTDAIVHLYLL